MSQFGSDDTFYVARASPGLSRLPMPPKKLDRRDFQIVDRTGERLVKAPGEINGLDFLLDGCVDCDIVLFDHTSQVFVDYCKKCRIVIGPVSGSVFIRNCEGCCFQVACGQLRTRDCEDCDVLVLVPGNPTIESSRNMRFGPLLRSYKGFHNHLEAAGLAQRLRDGEPCRWRCVYDFSGSGPKVASAELPWSCLNRVETEEVMALFLPLPAGDGDPAVEVIPDVYHRDGFTDEAGNVTGAAAAVPVQVGIAATPAIGDGMKVGMCADASSAYTLTSATVSNSATRAAEAPVLLPAAPCCEHCSATGVKLLLCSGCGSAWYCGLACQRAAWRAGHKGRCRRP